MMKRYPLFLFMVLLVGCASTPPQPSQTVLEPEKQEHAWRAHQAQVADAVHTWDVDGKVSIRQGRKANTVNLSWKQMGPDYYNIALRGPLNQGTVLLEGEPGYVTLRDASGKTDAAADAATLLQTHTGWSLPICSLYYWARGLPDPSFPGDYALNEQGQLAGIQQHGWLIAYDRYQTHAGVVLPYRMTLVHPEAEITLLLRSWQIKS